MSKPPGPKRRSQERQPPGEVPPVEPMESQPKSKERPLQELLDDAASKTSTVSVLLYSGTNPFGTPYKRTVRERDVAVEALKARVEKIDNPEELQTIINAAAAANREEVDMWVKARQMPKGGSTKAGAAVELCTEILVPRLEALGK